MMYKQIIVILIIALTFVIGFFKLRYIRIKLYDDIVFVNEYLEKFTTFIETYNTHFDGELYCWLTKKVPKIQSMLGHFGIAEYQPAFANYIFRNHEIISNTLHLMRARTAHSNEIGMSQEALIRYIGYIEEKVDECNNDLRNPLKWFQLGAQYIISLPVQLFYWFGLINKSTLHRIIDMYIFKLATFVITILGALSSLIAILQYLNIDITSL